MRRGLASAAALVYNTPATTFNAAGVHPDFVGANFAAANQLIDAYRVKGEILSTLQDSSFVNILHGVVEPLSAVTAIGGLMPDSVGKTYLLEGDSFSLAMRHTMGEVLSGMRKMM